MKIGKNSLSEVKKTTKFEEIRIFFLMEKNLKNGMTGEVMKDNKKVKFLHWKNQF